MLPLARSRCPALVAPGPSGSPNEPVYALAAGTLKPERTLSDFLNQAYGLTPAENDLMWKTTPPAHPPSQAARSRKIA